MADYLIALAIGPVQEFIIAAHKTRDLWFGSHLLSEVSKAAAKSLANMQDVELIFPAPEKLEYLEPSDKQDNFNVANKLLVKFKTDDSNKLKEVVRKAKLAACACWDELAQEALEKLKEKHVYIDVWKAQVDDVLELYGAWIKLGDNYVQARKDVEKLLSARKATRNFAPAQHPKEIKDEPKQGLPKSSLDAARESVLVRNEETDLSLIRTLNLSKHEHLDCPGVVKRMCGGNPEHFPAITRIALEMWFDLKEIPTDALKEIKTHYDALVNKGVATAVKTEAYKERLPYDGVLLYEDRIDALRRDIDEDATEILDALKRLEKARKPLYEKYNPPFPYFAVLHADGDRMGKVLDKCETAEQHREISQQLAKFAASAKTIIKNHCGAPVYTGGDDVLALLPVHKVIACAKKLADDFEEKLKKYAIDDKMKPTLSVGLGITHITTPFTLVMDLGRRAEKLAKNGEKGTKPEKQRNALGIILDVRSGVELQLRGRWDSNIAQSLICWQQKYQDNEFPNGLPYDLQEAVKRVVWAKDPDNKVDYKQVATQEIKRVLSKKRPEVGTKKMDKKMIEEIISAIETRNVETVVTELRLARWLAGKLERGA